MDLKIPGPKPKRQTGAAFEPRVDAWTLPFMGSDASVVRRTTAALAAEGKPYHSNVYLTLPSRRALFLFTLFGGVFAFLAGRGWGRRLLLAYPRFFTAGMFSHEGPNEQQLAETTFEMINIGRGYSKGRRNSERGSLAPSRPRPTLSNLASAALQAPLQRLTRHQT